MNTTSPLHWRNRAAKQTEHDGIQMTLIGGWSDLAAYYAGSDGLAWAYSFGLGWSCRGPLAHFRHFFATRHRGELLPA